jgi:putative membrane protein
MSGFSAQPLVTLQLLQQKQKALLRRSLQRTSRLNRALALFFMSGFSAHPLVTLQLLQQKQKALLRRSLQRTSRLNRALALFLIIEKYKIGDRGIKMLNELTFWDLWNPDILAAFILIGFIYYVLVEPLRDLFSSSKPVELKQKVLFITGIGVLYIATGSPLHIIGDDFLFSAHMFNQSLVYMLAPPLILFGIPNWLLQSLLKWGWSKKLLLFMTKPLVALLLFNALFSFYHIPAIFDFVVANGFLHNATHIILTMTAFLLWIPLVLPIKETEQLSYLQKIGYICAAGVLLYPACALIIFAGSPMYSTYIDAPQLLFSMSTLNDQQLGGIVMKIVQEIILGSFIGYFIFKWAKEERAEDKEVEHLLKARRIQQAEQS